MLHRHGHDFLFSKVTVQLSSVAFVLGELDPYFFYFIIFGDYPSDGAKLL